MTTYKPYRDDWREVRETSGRYAYKSKFKRFMHQVKVWTQRALMLSLGLGMLYGTFKLGEKVPANTSVSYAQAETKIVTVQAPEDYPIMDRIADCESGNGKKGSAKHFKNGQVILKGNTNKSVDIGKYQVNLTVWGAKASQLGYDLTKEADNKAMALWIYKNKGTGDWSASQNCWKR